MDLSAETVEGIRTWLDALCTHKAGFRRRREQDRAILAMASCLEPEGASARVVALEGPTGVGKSIAYVIAGLVAGRRHGKKLIVSTATVALQKQLANDLERLAQIAPVPIKAAVLKGRSRYVCDRNLAHLAGEDTDQLGLDLGGDSAGGHWPFQPTVAEREVVTALRAARSAKDWDGDLDGWRQKITGKIRPLLTTTSKGCAGPSCPYAARCPLLRARRNVFEADVIVTNHALLLADQRQSGGGALLPPLDEAIVIVDEAHHLPDVAVDAAAAGMVLGGHAKKIRKAIDVGRRAAGMRRKAYSQSIVDRLDSAEGEVVAALDALQSRVAEVLSRTDAVAVSRRYGRTFGRPTQKRMSASDFATLRDDLEHASKEAGWLLAQLEREQEKLSKDPPPGVGSGVLSRMSREVGESGDFMQSVVDTLTLLSTQDDDQAPVARWVNRDGQGNVEVHASPVDASAWLATVLWRRAFGVVAVSATLRAMGDFRHFAERSGLSRVREARFVALPSPFDLEGQAVLRVPAMVSEPSSEDEFLAEVMIELQEGVDPSEATLVLCASRLLMEAVVERMPASWKDRVKVQDQKSTGVLLDEHRADIAAGRGSILVGLASLAEGVDLPGKECSHVVIVKLPFMSPSDPVGETRAEWLESRGRSAFAEILLPDAHRRLVQACGRLIRTETDSGRITVLDRRLLTKTYGKKMLDTLPPYRRDIGVVLAEQSRPSGTTARRSPTTRRAAAGR